jgi:hypothetical protein
LGPQKFRRVSVNRTAHLAPGEHAGGCVVE